MPVTRTITALLLVAIALHRYATIRKPAGVDAYHRQIRDACASVPKRVGGWVGEDAPLPPRAIKVLDPNAVVSRTYVNVESGVVASVLFVHCADAHDMVGHFPLRCYTAQGWDVRDAAERDWAVGGVTLTGMEYQFRIAAPDRPTGEQVIVVANSIFRPDGRVIRDMSALSKSIVGAGGQATGAGQLQISFDAGVPRDRRDEAIHELVAGFRPAIDAVLAKGPQ